MKRNKTKLVLARETLATLQVQSLEAVAGGNATRATHTISNAVCPTRQCSLFPACPGGSGGNRGW